MSGPSVKDQVLDTIAKDFVRARLHTSEPQKAPVAIILAGQSGAGKSTLASDLAEELARKGGYITADADLMRPFLPPNATLASDASNPAEVAQRDAGRVAQAVAKHAIAARRNLVVDGTLREPEVALQLAKGLKAAGYTVELHALAVNEQISYERATRRYETDITTNGTGRRVPKDWHDQSYQGVAQSVRRLEYAAAVDRVAVYNRLGDPIIDQAPQPGQTAAITAFERARTQLTGFERISLAKNWDDIAESMEQRGASKAEFAEVMPAMQRAHHTLRSSPEAAEAYDYDRPSEIHRSKDLAEGHLKPQGLAPKELAELVHKLDGASRRGELHDASPAVRHEIVQFRTLTQQHGHPELAKNVLAQRLTQDPKAAERLNASIGSHAHRLAKDHSRTVGR